MNKEEIKKIIQTLPFSKEDYWVITGAAMVLYGLREQTHDIDLGAKKSLIEALEQNGYETIKLEDGSRKIIYSDQIEIFEEWKYGSILSLEGIPLLSLTGLLEMKKSLGRKKDEKDIELLMYATKESVYGTD